MLVLEDELRPERDRKSFEKLRHSTNRSRGNSQGCEAAESLSIFGGGQFLSLRDIESFFCKFLLGYNFAHDSKSI